MPNAEEMVTLRRLIGGSDVTAASITSGRLVEALQVVDPWAVVELLSTASVTLRAIKDTAVDDEFDRLAGAIFPVFTRFLRDAGVEALFVWAKECAQRSEAFLLAEVSTVQSDEQGSDKR